MSERGATPVGWRRVIVPVADSRPPPIGCAYYPWRGLDVVPVMQYIVLINPMVYVAEGMRGALTPGVPHMPLGVVHASLVLISGFFWTFGIRSFNRRAIG